MKSFFGRNNGRFFPSYLFIYFILFLGISLYKSCIVLLLSKKYWIKKKSKWQKMVNWTKSKFCMACCIACIKKKVGLGGVESYLHRWDQSSISVWDYEVHWLHSSKSVQPCPQSSQTWEGSSAWCHLSSRSIAKGIKRRSKVTSTSSCIKASY